MLDVYMEIWNSRKQELPIQEARIKMIDKPILLVLITDWSFCFCPDRPWTVLRRLALRWLVGRSAVTPGHVSLLPTTAKARQSNQAITPHRVRCNAMCRYLKPTNSTFFRSSWSNDDHLDLTDFQVRCQTSGASCHRPQPLAQFRKKSNVCERGGWWITHWQNQINSKSVWITQYWKNVTVTLSLFFLTLVQNNLNSQIEKERKNKKKQAEN